MPLLLLPLLLIAFVLVWALLLPLALLQRYRRGHARRRARAWAVRFNAWLMLVSVLLFVATAWLVGHWVDAALAHASTGLALGIVIGIIGLWLTRFEFGESHAGLLVYTPNRWLVLALTGVVALRIGYGLLRGWQWSRGQGDAAEWLAQQGNLLAVGGLLLGHYLAYAWGLRRRLPRGPGLRPIR